MEIAAVVERVGAIASVRADAAASVDLIESGLVAVREVQAWCDAQHAGLVTQLEGIDSFPEQRIAKASKKSLEGDTLEDRVDHAVVVWLRPAA